MVGLSRQGDDKMTTFVNRKDIRNAMKNIGAEKYRIKEGQVQFYGVMPNSNLTGWYTAGYSAI